MCRCNMMFCVFLWCVYVSASQKCTSMTSESLKFGIASRFNQSGHWVGQVTLNHGAKEGAGVWEIDVDHNKTECDGDQSVAIVATITAPHQNIYNAPRIRAKLDSSYKLVPGLGYYKLHTQKSTWHVAREQCATEGAHLVILNSAEELSAVQEMWSNSDVASAKYLHVGISDFVNEGQYVTLFGEPLSATGYTEWAPGQPDGGTNQNCGFITINGLLQDQKCEDSEIFMCEIELSQVALI